MKKVLIAEDDIDQINRLTTMLDKYSDKFEVIPVRDGKEAIDVLKEESVSLLVTDIQMPQMNGMVLLAYVHTYYPRIPCIVISAYGTSRLKSKLPKDLLRFFQKPLNIDDLAHAIIAALKRDNLKEGAQGISVLSFIKMIEMEKSSCIFEMQTPEKNTGALYFEKGILWDAKCGNLTGEAAALELFGWKSATYRFKAFPEKKIERRIKTDLGVLILNVVDNAIESSDSDG
jgi:YesN/AraC family two-component response regulator